MGYITVDTDCVVNLYDGGTWDGAATLGAAVPVQAFATALEADDGVPTIDTAAMADTTVKLRPGKKTERARVTLEVKDTGLISGFAVGNVARIGHKPLTAGTEKTWTGIVVRNAVRVANGQPQEQTIEVEGPADGTVA